jgi:hypothetical protein
MIPEALLDRKLIRSPFLYVGTVQAWMIVHPFESADHPHRLGQGDPAAQGYWLKRSCAGHPVTSLAAWRRAAAASLMNDLQS